MEHSKYWTFINDRAASHIEAANVFKLADVRVYDMQVLSKISALTGEKMTSYPGGHKEYPLGGASVTSGETTYHYKFGI